MKFEVACVQTNPQDDLARNLEEAVALVGKAAREGAHVVVLPEMFTYMGADSGRIATADAMGDGVFAKLAALAKECGIHLIAGSHAETSGTAGRVFNTSVAYGPGGETLSTYRKIHLFNLRDEDGKPLYCESDTFAKGDTIAGWSLDAKGEQGPTSLRCLTAICYDLRFPETFRKETFGVLFLPAAFTHQTGQDHWEVLLRARAIENQSWVVACNQTGMHSQGRKRNYGNSMVVDPWGRVTARLGEETGLLRTSIDTLALKDARNRLPALMDRVL